jgi:uncharacterized protein YjeT (DUF2065 family)
MDVSIFLAKIMGIYLVIVGLAYFFRRDFFRAVITDFYNSPALIALASIINLVIGLLVVLNHNIWEFSWKVVITILGYVSVLKGIMNLFAPEVGRRVSIKIVEKDWFVYSGVISLALGVYLLYQGFFEYFQKIMSN